jgi:hypothetical protein
MSEQRNPKQVDSLRVLIENRKNGGSEPPSFSPDLPANKTLFNFGKGFSEKALLPNATQPIWATHISQTNQNYVLSVATSGNVPGPFSIEGTGTPVALNNGDKVDIQRWTIIANPKF